MISSKEFPKKYHYLIMAQDDMIQNQVLEEVLREKASYYSSKNKSLDFWLLISPSFIKNLQLEKEIKKSNFYTQKMEKGENYYGALVSLDKEFINWIQLRLGYFENINDQFFNKSNLKYVSDGIYGSFDLKLLQNSSDAFSPLSSKKNFLNPKIVISGYKKIISFNK